MDNILHMINIFRLAPEEERVRCSILVLRLRADRGTQRTAMTEMLQAMVHYESCIGLRWRLKLKLFSQAEQFPSLFPVSPPQTQPSHCSSSLHTAG